MHNTVKIDDEVSTKGMNTTPYSFQNGWSLHEVYLSNCTYGCKIYEAINIDAKHVRPTYVLFHNKTYGCNK